MTILNKLPGIYVNVLGRKSEQVPPKFKLYLLESTDCNYRLLASKSIHLNNVLNSDNLTISADDKHLLSSILDENDSLVIRLHKK